jgi:hypothetical protein
LRLALSRVRMYGVISRSANHCRNSRSRTWCRPPPILVPVLAIARNEPACLVRPPSPDSSGLRCLALPRSRNCGCPPGIVVIPQPGWRPALGRIGGIWIRGRHLVLLMHRLLQRVLLFQFLQILSCKDLQSSRLQPFLGSSALSFLLTSKSPEPCLSRQVPRRPETALSPQEATVWGQFCSRIAPVPLEHVLRVMWSEDRAHLIQKQRLSHFVDSRRR